MNTNPTPRSQPDEKPTIYADRLAVEMERLASRSEAHGGTLHKAFRIVAEWALNGELAELPPLDGGL